MIPDARDAARRTYNRINRRLTNGKAAFTVGKQRCYIAYDFGTIELVGNHVHWHSSFGEDQINLPLDENGAWERVLAAVSAWEERKRQASGQPLPAPDEAPRDCERCKEDLRDTREAPSTARKQTEVITDKSGPIGDAAIKLWRKIAVETGGRIVDDAPSEWFIPDGKSKSSLPPQHKRRLRLGRLTRHGWLEDEDEYREEEEATG